MNDQKPMLMARGLCSLCSCAQVRNIRMVSCVDSPSQSCAYMTFTSYIENAGCLLLKDSSVAFLDCSF